MTSDDRASADPCPVETRLNSPGALVGGKTSTALVVGRSQPHGLNPTSTTPSLRG